MNMHIIAKQRTHTCTLCELNMHFQSTARAPILHCSCWHLHRAQYLAWVVSWRLSLKWCCIHVSRALTNWCLSDWRGLVHTGCITVYLTACSFSHASNITTHATYLHNTCSRSCVYSSSRSRLGLHISLPEPVPIFHYSYIVLSIKHTA